MHVAVLGACKHGGQTILGGDFKLQLQVGNRGDQIDALANAFGLTIANDDEHYWFHWCWHHARFGFGLRPGHLSLWTTCWCIGQWNGLIGQLGSITFAFQWNLAPLASQDFHNAPDGFLVVECHLNLGRYSFFGSILNDVFRQSVGTWPVLIKSLKWPTKVSMKESGTCFKISAMRPHSSADFCTFIRLNALCTSPFSHAIYVNCVGSKSPPGSPAKSSSSMSANSFGSGCCETVRCDAAGIRGRCIPGGCFQDVLHGEIVFTCLAPFSRAGSGWSCFTGHLPGMSTSSKLGVLVCAEGESRRLTVFGLRLSWRIYDPNEVCVVPATPWIYVFSLRMSRLLDQLKPARFQNHWNSSLSFPPLTLSQLGET